MKGLFVSLTFLFLAAGSVSAQSPSPEIFLKDLADSKEVTLSRIVPALEKKRLVVVGEYHTDEESHLVELAVIKALHRAGVHLAIGLEMFEANYQAALDGWVSGQMNAKTFREIYNANWNFPWPLYRGIFEYAREKHIPLIGLNVPPEVTQQVALEGFQSLSPDHKKKLPNITCTVGPEYEAFIKKAYGEHGHGDFKFSYFCEAQLVWDESMAINAVNYLKAHPESLMVLLTGAGHAWKKGIPAQVKKRFDIPYTVILPKGAGADEFGPLKEDADYVVVRVLKK